MTKKILFIGVLLILSANKAAHEYYVGLTEITYNPEKDRIEIISRLFHDDFENLLL